MVSRERRSHCPRNGEGAAERGAGGVDVSGALVNREEAQGSPSQGIIVIRFRR